MTLNFCYKNKESVLLSIDEYKIMLVGNGLKLFIEKEKEMDTRDANSDAWGNKPSTLSVFFEARKQLKFKEVRKNFFVNR